MFVYISYIILHFQQLIFISYLYKTVYYLDVLNIHNVVFVMFDLRTKFFFIILKYFLSLSHSLSDNKSL